MKISGADLFVKSLIEEKVEMLFAYPGEQAIDLFDARFDNVVVATAVVEKSPVIICIFNNGCLGNVRQWPEMFFDGRYAYTDLRPGEDCDVAYVPDFLKLAASYGVPGFRVRDEGQIDTVLARACETHDRPVKIWRV